MKLLQIDSSARSTSVTRKLTAKFAEEWKKTYPAGEVIHRDLAATVVPLITDDWGATYGDPSQVTPAQSSYLATSDQLIDELQSADTVVIGAPMYNFSVPAPLKAWIDQIVRMGKTFSIGANGAQGLLGGKNGVVITSRGGAYDKASARRAFDFQEPYLQAILGFIGLTDLTFVHAENQMSERAPASIATAAERIEGIVAQQSRQPVPL